MTHSPPPEPPSREDSLGFDDFVGIFVAIAGIGAILFWVIGPKLQRFALPSFDARVSPPAQTDSLISPPGAGSSPVESPAPEGFTPGAQIPGAATVEPPQESGPLPSQTTVQPAPAPLVPIPVPVPSASSTTPTPAASTLPGDTGFSDVSPSFWAAPFIASLQQRGVLAGGTEGTFQPNAPITRAEIAIMLDKAFAQPASRQPLQFSDVSDGYWASSAIAQSVQTGFMQGYPGGVFRPELQIPKVQLLVALVSGLELSIPPDPAQVVGYYQDSGQIPQYAIDKVAAATANGMVINYPNTTTLNPEQPITRAEAAALIYQALVKAGRADRVTSEYRVQP